MEFGTFYEPLLVAKCRYNDEKSVFFHDFLQFGFKWPSPLKQGIVETQWLYYQYMTFSSSNKVKLVSMGDVKGIVSSHPGAWKETWKIGENSIEISHFNVYTRSEGSRIISYILWYHLDHGMECGNYFWTVEYRIIGKNCPNKSLYQIISSDPTTLTSDQ